MSERTEVFCDWCGATLSGDALTPRKLRWRVTIAANNKYDACQNCIERHMPSAFRVEFERDIRDYKGPLPSLQGDPALDLGGNGNFRG